MLNLKTHLARDGFKEFYRLKFSRQITSMYDSDYSFWLLVLAFSGMKPQAIIEELKRRTNND